MQFYLDGMFALELPGEHGEYEDLNGAALYKMEVAGFGPEDLTEPLADARRTPVRKTALLPGEALNGAGFFAMAASP
jgi:hypothetical protein